MQYAEIEALGKELEGYSAKFAAFIQKVFHLPEVKADPRVGMCIANCATRMSEAEMWMNKGFQGMAMKAEDHVDAAIEQGLKEAGFKPEIVK